MRICWIVDNKFRDLYNLFILKKRKKNLNLIIINKFNCLEALEFLNLNLL